VPNSVGLNGAIYSSRNSILSSQESASNVAKIVDGSRDKAKRMVDIAIKVLKGPDIALFAIPLPFHLILPSTLWCLPYHRARIELVI